VVWLPDGDKISKIGLSLFVLTERTNVTDGHRMKAQAALDASIARHVVN